MLKRNKERIYNLKANAVSYENIGNDGDQMIDIVFSEAEKELALEIIKKFDGMTISRSCSILDKVKKALLQQVICL